MCRDVFVDESSQTKHRFLLLGGLITRVHEPELTASLNAARGAELPFGELGWVKVSRGKLAAYKRFVDVFFLGGMATHLDFHSIVIDTHQIDDHTDNSGSRSAGFDKEVYQLLLKFAQDPQRDTARTGKFTIWHRQLRKPLYRR